MIKERKVVANDRKTIYRAPTEAAEQALEAFAIKWGRDGLEWFLAFRTLLRSDVLFTRRMRLGR
jgi:hypothetical protein